MEQDAEASLVVVWQAEFWRRNGETYWIDFPRHISEALEKGRKSGRSFVYRLNPGSPTPPPPTPPKCWFYSERPLKGIRSSGMSNLILFTELHSWPQAA